MPQNWKTYQFDELYAQPSRNGLNKPKRVRGEGVKMVNMGELFAYSFIGSQPMDRVPVSDTELSNSTLEEGDLLFARQSLVESGVGKCSLIKGLSETTVFESHIIRVRPNQSISDSTFLYYLFQSASMRHQIMSLANGVAAFGIKGSDLSAMKLTLPEIQEQKSIASILSALDDKIENNLAMNKTLEEMAMALYKHWFVDFGPFQEGEFVPSELGSIPKGWEVKKLGELIHIKHGFAFKGKQFTQEERKELLLTPGNFEASGGIKFNWGKQKFYSGDFPEEYILNQGDLILALTDLTQDCAILGAPAIIPDEDFYYLHNQRLGLVQQQSYLTNEIMYLIANSHDFREYIRGSKTGSTVSHTSPSRIYEFTIPVPPKEQLSALNTQVSPVLQKTYSNLSENKALSKLRDTLLPKLISGEVRVKDVEQTLANAL